MTLDIRTLVVTLMASAVLMAVTLAFGLRAGRSAGFGKWNLGLGMYALGWLVVAARPVLPAIVGIAFADALLLAGLCFQLGGMLEFDGRRAPGWLLGGPATLLFLLLLPILDDYAALTFFTSSAYSAAFVALGVYAVRLKRSGAGPVRWLMAVLLFGGAATLMARAIDIAASPVDHPEMFSGHALHALAFLQLLAITITTSVGFLVLQRERAEARLQHLAMFDSLTEMLNRRAFMDLAGRERSRGRRAGLPCSFLMLDLDYFKQVNDEYGHQAGDRVLVEFAALVKSCLRAEDLVCRYGGEEFCVMLPGTGAPAAREIAERIRAAAASRPLGGLPQATTASIGISVSGGPADSLDAAISRADGALYAAKRAGRNTG